MAGHSKWANIKHRKAAQDARKGRLFTRLIREITVAARLGGEDHPRLRAAVERALAANIPRDTINRAVQRGQTAGNSEHLEEVIYEGYAPGGVALLVEVMTDNRNRAVAAIRHAFQRAGGSLGTDGSVAYLFRQRGWLALAADNEEDAVLEVALEAGAEDVVGNADGTWEVLSAPDRLLDVRDGLRQAGIEPRQAEVVQWPETRLSLEEAPGRRVLALINALEELEDVQNVYSNARFPEQLLAETEEEP